MSGEKLSYFTRRAAQELAAADAASNKAAADAHRVLAKRFTELAENEACMDEPLLDLRPD